MQVKFDLKLSVYSLGLDIWLLSFTFNFCLMGWPSQPPRERVPKINKIVGFWWAILTPARTLFISGLKSWVMKLPFLSLKMMVKSGLEFILKLTEPLQSCCCPVQKYLSRLAELAWQLSRYLWRGSVNFKINSRPLFKVLTFWEGHKIWKNLPHKIWRYWVTSN